MILNSFFHCVFLVVLADAATASATLPWVAGPGFRSVEIQPQTLPSGKPGFTLLSLEVTGIRFTNELTGETYATNLVAHNGSGVAIGDIDGDGWADIYLCSLQGRNRLFRNLGNWRFMEMEIGAAACEGQLSTGAAFADVDGDGDPDLLVNGIGAGTRLFLNDGKGHWAEAKDSGLSRTASATSLALADIDGDGDLDLYCAHYIDVMHLADTTMRFALARRGDRWEVTKVNGESARLPRWKDRFEALADGKVRELPEVDGFYRNDGHGHFTPIQNEPGVFLDEHGQPIPPFRDWGLAVMFRDLNGDGAPDLCVCNDNASPNRIWINKGNGTFQLADSRMFRHTSRSSMGIDIADINRDGRDDILVVDMLARDHAKRMTQLARDLPDPKLRELIGEQPRFNRNTLFLGRADGSYAEVAFMAGLAATDWSFCPIFVDVDLDGYEDLLVSNGFTLDVMDQDSHDLARQRQRQLPPEQARHPHLLHPGWPTLPGAFRNRGDGTFTPMGREWGFDRPGVAHGMALGDLDNDGDLDLVVNNLNAPASLYRNDATAGRVEIRLKGLAPNTQGIGARMRLAGGTVAQTQEMIGGGRYLSGDQAARVFATVGNPAQPLWLEVKWRNGEESKLEVQPNRIYEVDQAGARPSRELLGPRLPFQPYFSETIVPLNHAHTEEAFDDWSLQPLLPRRLSRLGPAVGWCDLNGDGWEDLVVAAGRGGQLGIFLSDRGRGFLKVEGIPVNPGGQGGLVAWPDGRGQRQLVAAFPNYGLPPGTESRLAAYSLANPAVPQTWPAGQASLGPLAVADIDGDGDLDLFAGGRCRSGRYPEPVNSSIWLNDHGVLKVDSLLSQPLAGLGLVSGAVFCDLDGDGAPDLALALEWGPIRIFHNENGRLVDRTAQLGLAETSGWWTSIAAGDFDGDGRMDLVAGNWGRNSFYELHQPGPWRIFYGDWNGDGTLELVEAWRNAGQWLPVRSRQWLAVGLPEVQEAFPSHMAYGKATVPDILGARFQEAGIVEAAVFESSLFLNRGSRFERRPLPAEAQQTPAFSVNVGDFDGDGIEDIFLAQNFFGAASDLSRDDGGRGLWLRGSGDGTFAPVDSGVSGIIAYGEQRGAALADFNHDGRVDLALSQNNAPTRLFTNQRARRGLRVTLKGPPANPDAIGAQMRLVYPGGGRGPCRSVQAGSGYGSQDAPVQVLGLADAPSALWIRWPGGREQTVPLQPGMWEVEVPSESR